MKYFKAYLPEIGDVCMDCYIKGVKEIDGNSLNK